MTGQLCYNFSSIISYMAPPLLPQMSITYSLHNPEINLLFQQGYKYKRVL